MDKIKSPTEPLEEQSIHSVRGFPLAGLSRWSGIGSSNLSLVNLLVSTMTQLPLIVISVVLRYHSELLW